MKTPSWLLNILCSYLIGRSMMLTYNGAVSTIKLLPSGCPQGAYIGGLIFIIKFNAAFLRPPIPRPPKSLNDPKSIQVKYIDDGSVAVRVNLKECLALDPITRPKPFSYYERSGHILPSHNSFLHHIRKPNENQQRKAKTMKFTNSRSIDLRN